MKKIFLLSSLFAAALSLVSFAGSAQETGSTTLKGFLMDKMCSNGVMASKDPVAAARQHTKECATEDHCALTGYGIVADGKFYVFDKKGNALVKEMLKNTSKTDNLSIEVVGTQAKDGKLKVEALKESE
ncbi:MAG: hypothetical protein ACRD63_05765 [Pyrinomonadaceae bacterium]